MIIDTTAQKAKKPLPTRRAPIDGPTSPAATPGQSLPPSRERSTPYLDGVVGKASC